MKSARVNVSGGGDEWATPDKLFREISKEFGPFDLDPCASEWNHKTDKYFTKIENGLHQKWFGKVFMNPPYSEIRKWMEKAYYEVLYGSCQRVVCLVFARTETKWFHDFGIRGKIKFIRSKVCFYRHDGKTGRAPMPSILIIFDKDMLSLDPNQLRFDISKNE